MIVFFDCLLIICQICLDACVKIQWFSRTMKTLKTLQD